MFATGSLAGCSDDSTCTTDRDCFAGQTCENNSCVTVSTNNATSNNATTNNQTTNNTTANNVTTNNVTANNATTASDAGGVDSGGSDAGTPDMSMPLGCVVDPFDVETCPDDGNDRFAERFEASTVGCQRDGFVPLDLTRTERMCAVEAADRYEVGLVECDNQTVRVEWVFRPLVSCNRELINLEATAQGKRCSEQDQSPDIQCGWNENGEFIAQILVRDMGSISTTFFTIDTNMNSNVDFEYELTARVSQ